MTTIHSNVNSLSRKVGTSWSPDFFNDDQYNTASGSLTTLARRQDALYKYDELEDDAQYAEKEQQSLNATENRLFNGFYRFSASSFMLPCELEPNTNSPESNDELLTPDSVSDALESAFYSGPIPAAKTISEPYIDREPEHSRREDVGSLESFYEDRQDETVTLKGRFVPTLRVNRYSRTLNLIPAIDELTISNSCRRPMRQDTATNFKSLNFESFSESFSAPEVYEEPSNGQLQPIKSRISETTGCPFIRKWVYKPTVQKLKARSYNRLPLYKIPELRFEATPWLANHYSIHR